MKTLLLSLMLGAALVPAAAQETVSHGRFKEVRLYRPKGEVKTVALLFSGANGWGAGGPGAAAQVLLDTGAVVAAIDTPSLLANFNQDGGTCVVPEGDVENLSRFLQGYARLPAYYPPLAVGVGSGGALAYAMAAQAPEGTFSGAVSIGFCPSLPLAKQMDLVEKTLIEQALRRCGGKVPAAMELLGTPRKTLYDKLHRHGIVLDDFR